MAVNITSTAYYTLVDNALVSAYPFTMSAWFYMQTAPVGGTTEIILQCADNSASAEYFRVEIFETGGNVNARIVARKASENASNSGTTNIPADSWHLLTGVFRSSTDDELYLDGVSEVTLTPTAVTWDGTRDSLGIGHEVDSVPGNPLLDTNVSDVAVWDVALSANEILAMGSGAPPNSIRSSALKAYWPLYNADHLSDFSANGKTLTKVSTPTSENHAPVGRSVTPAPPYNLSPNVNQIGTISGSVQIAGRALLT